MHTVELLLFDEVDLLDVGGPYEVLLTANRLVVRDGGTPPFEVVLTAVGDGPVTAYGGLGLAPSAPLDLDREVDVLVVPGAVDLDAVTPALPTIATRAARAELVTSVCTGSVLLARAGALDAAVATTHHEDLDVLRDAAPGTEVVAARWVDAGTVVTGGGLSSGLALGLHLVDRLVSRELAVRTAAQIAHPFDPDDGVTRPG